MAHLDPAKQREFALEVVRLLRERGFTAYWAGGCVRDFLVERVPKDYDVATSARPEEIQAAFPRRKTLAMGAAFGVMTVVGPRPAGQIEVATFRQDASYSDGRHPDAVSFSSPEEDAKRRDFTINGMFYDPVAEQVIDFVGGQADLEQGLIRAIGSARERFTEDKLRMLRAVRFAASFGFRIEPETLAAIQEMAAEVTVVSAERIADEMRAVLVCAARVRAVGLLYESGLLAAIVPELAAVAEREGWGAVSAAGESDVASDAEVSSRTLALLGAVEEPGFPLALAILMRGAKNDHSEQMVGQRWKLKVAEKKRLGWLLEHWDALAGAREKQWSELQPFLVGKEAEDLIKLGAAQGALGLIDLKDVEYCQARVARPRGELDPARLVTGADLIALGIPTGPIFARLLKRVRERQLNGELVDRAAAMALVEKLWREKSA